MPTNRQLRRREDRVGDCEFEFWVPRFHTRHDIRGVSLSWLSLSQEIWSVIKQFVDKERTKDKEFLKKMVTDDGDGDDDDYDGDYW